MKGLQIEEPGNIRLKEIAKPGLSTGEILIKINYVGFCGSDLSTFLGRNPLVEYPRVPGHEISGKIMDIGPGVPDSFSKGESVTVIPYTSCGKCSSCRRGRTNACQNNQTLGVQRNGAMQEIISIPWQKVIKAEQLSELELAFVEPLTVGFHAAGRGRITDEDVVAVMGCGMIGSGALINAGLLGAKVIAIDIDDHKLEIAKLLGAHHVINTKKINLHEALLRITHGDGPDVIIEAAGNPLTYRAAVDEIAFAGRVVCIGYTASEVSFATKFFVQKELDIMGSRNASAEDFRAVISYLEGGTFPLDKMLTRKVKPEVAAPAIRKWSEDPGKVMKILLDLT